MNGSFRVLLLFALVFPVATNAQIPTKVPTKRLYVKAVDRTGAPVAGLTVDDFFLAEAGYEQIITKVVPVNDPVRVVMLVDDSKDMASALADVRQGLLAFADALPDPHEIALVTIGTTPAVRQEPTTDRGALKAAAGKISANGAPVLLGSVVEMYDRFLKAPGRWPMVVIVGNEGNDASPGVTQDKFVNVVRDLQATDTVVHAVMMPTPVKVTSDTVQVARALTKSTGGTYELISTASALPDKLAALAKVILEQHRQSSAQYIIEYQTDPKLDPAKAAQMPTVAAVREGMKLTLSQQGRIR